MPAPLHKIIVSIILALRQHAARKAAFYTRCLRFVPYLVGPILIIFDPSDPSGIESLKRYAAYVLLLASWEILVSTALQVRIKKESADRQAIKVAQSQRSRKKHKDSPSDSKSTGLSDIAKWEISSKQKLLMVVSGFTTIIGMQLFRGYFQDLVFLLVLAIFTFGLITAFLQRPIPGKQRLLLSLSTELLYLSGVGYLGCVALQGTLLYQPLVVSAAFAAAVMAPTLIQRLTAMPVGTDISLSDFNYLNRAFAILTVFPPMVIGLLVYADQLTVNYLLVFTALMVSSPILRQLPRRGSTEVVAIQSSWLSPISSGIFVMIFIALRALG